MNIVIDTSALIAVIVNEPIKAKLIEQTRGTELYAPRSVHWEIGNAFSAMLKRNRMSAEQAVAALEVYERIAINWTDVELTAAIDLSAQLQIYAYDAYLLAAALNQKCPILTLDSGLKHAAKVVGVAVIEVEVSDANLS